MNQESKKGITVTVLGRDLELSMLSTVLVEGMGAVRYRDAYGIKSLSGENWLFDYGVLVSWGVAKMIGSSSLRGLLKLRSRAKALCRWSNTLGKSQRARPS